MRSDDVVPVSMEAVAFQVDTVHRLVGDSPPGGVFAAVQTTDDLQAPRGRRPRDQVDAGFLVAQRPATPIPGGETAKARAAPFPTPRSPRGKRTRPRSP